jgi:predicted RNA-binding Zn ribbon-like protein
MARLANPQSEWTFELLGGSLCLDFINTVSGKRAIRPIERLHQYADLLSWSRQVGISTAAECRELLAQSLARPQEAANTFQESIKLREALFRIFTVVAQRREPTSADLQLLNTLLARSLGHQRLATGSSRISLEWFRTERDLDCVLWPIVKSAADLLTSEETSRIRICEATSTDGCGWLFLDETRNRTRRWCSMKDCGNRAKARRHYRRHRTEAAS